MIAGDLEIKVVLQICGFLGNFYGRAIFIVYCGVNMLVFNSGAAGVTDTINTISSICGWICIFFGFTLAFLKCFTKSDSLLSQELENYLAKHRASPEEAKTAA